MKILGTQTVLFHEGENVSMAQFIGRASYAEVAKAAYDHIDFTPPQGVRDAAQKGLNYRDEFGRGGTAVGVARARDLSNGKTLSPSTLRRMKSYFARHAVDSNGKDWANASNPSAGYVAWLLWGGDAGKSWCEKVCKQMDAADGKETSNVRVLASKRVPMSGDKFVLGLAQHPVIGYELPVKKTATTEPVPGMLLYHKSHADFSQIRVDVNTLKALDDDVVPCWWIAKTRVTGGNKIWFNVEFLWHTGKTFVPTKATSLRSARQNALYRIGRDFCNKDPNHSVSAAVQAAKDGLAAAAGMPFSNDLLTVTPSLKN